MTDAAEVDIPVSERIGTVPGLFRIPDGAWAMLSLAHGAGAGMRHPFMEALADALAGQGLATLRYQFPYMHQGGRRPDPPAVLEATVRAALARARERMPALLLLAGGKSLGGRMTSGAMARQPSAGVAGLVFVGFPLHPPKQPAITRGEHLDRVTIPMLFLQGTRDDLADLSLITGVCGRLGPRATLHVVDGADHAFAVLKRSGRTGDQVMDELARTTAEWARPLRPATAL